MPAGRHGPAGRGHHLLPGHRKSPTSAAARSPSRTCAACSPRRVSASSRMSSFAAGAEGKGGEMENSREDRDDGDDDDDYYYYY